MEPFLVSFLVLCPTHSRFAFNAFFFGDFFFCLGFALIIPPQYLIIVISNIKRSCFIYMPPFTIRNFDLKYNSPLVAVYLKKVVMNMSRARLIRKKKLEIQSPLICWSASILWVAFKKSLQDEPWSLLNKRDKKKKKKRPTRSNLFTPLSPAFLPLALLCCVYPALK